MDVQEHTVWIARPPDEVFAFMDAVDREHEWQPALTEASKEPAGATQPGTHKRYVSEFMGRRVENTYVVRVFDPPRYAVYESTEDSAVAATLEVRWEAEDRGTRVTMAIVAEPRGALGRLPVRLLEASYRKQLAGSLERLKKILETGD